MIKTNIALAFIICIACFSKAEAQDTLTIKNNSKKHKGLFYIGFGYNKDWYTKSSIHFKNYSHDLNPVTGKEDYYDFTIHDATAEDRPGFNEIFQTNISIPQYVYRIGYYFNDKRDLGLEISFDHIKYVVNDDQTVHVTGQIFGTPVDNDTLLQNWFHFEHTDGGNLLQLNLLKRFQFYKTPNGNFKISGIIKPGGGVVVPRTDVTLFGERLNNKFHIAGYVLGLEGGVRAEFFKYGFLESSIKGDLANYTDVLVIGAGKANHKIGVFEVIANIGVQFPL